jgi:hypothetical protein
VYLRLRHLGLEYMQPGEYLDVPIGKVLHIVQRSGLLGAEQRGTHSRSLMVVMVHGLVRVHTLLIHS